MKNQSLIQTSTHHGAFAMMQIVALCAVLMLFGCQSNSPKMVVKPAQATPTINPIFLPLPTSTSPTPTPKQPTPTLNPVTPTAMVVVQETAAASLPVETTPTEAAAPSLTPTVANLIEVPIYSDQTNSNWVLRSSGPGVSYVFQDSAQAHDDKYAMSITFRKDNSYFDFVVRQGAAVRYLRDNTYGIRFWLYSNDRPLAVDSIGVGIFGSQKLPFMLVNDASVNQAEFDPVFNKENKYLVGLSQEVPANTWVQVEIPLDSLKYNTNYQYITGVRFRNNTGFQGKIFIDNFVLLQSPTAP